ncbi:MAG: methionine--tRNA ligase, partial [Alphaproteobacteria bacterium]|nr:methionine--tRNA ligase [Alphaproteobacteria bacterium]
DEAFYGESELTAGPDGKKIAPTGAPVEWVEEPSYFFELSKWQEPLLKFYAENPDFVYPASRFNEVKRFVEGGLEDLSVSRTSFKWGIPVPGDEKHVIYVWLDALFNYVSALEWPEGENYKQFWEKGDVYHVVGKDILRFHAVYWPAFLMAAGMKPPSRVIAHGWWTNEGQKISKSLGNVIDPLKLVEEFGLDATRYFLMREVPFGNDGNYSRVAMINRINAELANNIGNLCQRTLSMIAKNCGGKVPEVRDEALTEEDRAFLNALWVTDRDTPKAVTSMYLDCKFYEILQEIVQMAGQANEYIDKQAPWGLKDNPARRDAILYCLAEGIRCLAIYLQPFIPESAAKILDYLAIPGDQRGFAHTHHYGKGLGKYSLEPGTPLPVPQGVFPRYVEKAA